MLFRSTSDVAKFAGKIIVKPIGIPENAEKYVGIGDLTTLYQRNVCSKKGDSGKVLVIAGGAYTGAPALAGMAALRIGCDIVTIAAPSSVYDIIASFAPELIVRKLSREKLSEDDIPELIELIQAHDVVIIGPGLGKDTAVLNTAAKLIPHFKKAVIDADALRPEILKALEQNTMRQEKDIILTPHFGEFSRIAEFLEVPLKLKKDETPLSEREKYASEICEKLNAVILLKGAPDLIVGKGKEVRYNSTGNAGMTVGGTGDVLAGITGGLLAKNKSFDAACCGAFICGRAGDFAFEKKGNDLIPSDILKKISKASTLENPVQIQKTGKMKKNEKNKI